jgi:hypothetical protein
LPAEKRQRARGVRVDAALVADDLGLKFGVGIGEFDRGEALAGGGLEVFGGGLVAGVVGDDEEEVGVGGHGSAEALDRQGAAVVGEGVQDDGGVLAGLDDLVEVADRAAAHGLGEGAVEPAGALGGQQVAADEVG